MDLTFEDVAHVIQDVRFQQAIGKTDPEPEKKIKLPAKNFDLSKFIEDYKISLESLINEPLGRFFLEKFADVTEVSNLNSTSETKSQSHASDILLDYKLYERDVNGFFHQVLKFVEELFFARKSAPSGVVETIDIIVLVEKYKLWDLFNEAMEDPAVEKKVTEKGSKKESLPDLHFEVLKKEFEERHELFTEKNESASSTFSGQKSPSGTPRHLTQLGNNNTSKDVNVENYQPSSINEALSENNVTLETNLHNTLRNSMNKGETREPLSETKQHSGGRVKMAQTVETESTEKNLEISGNYFKRDGAGLHLVEGGKTPSLRTQTINEKLSRKISQVLVPLYEELLKDKEVFMEYAKFKLFSTKNVDEKNIHYHRLLGQGAFGTVYGCLISQIGVMLAMKILIKKKVKLKRARSQVKAERDALELLALHPSPYCMQLRYAFQTVENFHLILPLAVGGDLKYHLRNPAMSNNGRVSEFNFPLELNRARIYCAEIAFGLGHLHKLGLLMRDLKPRNVLLDEQGHCKISDFGLAVGLREGKLITGKAGTEGYWSPEVINGQSYGIDADWWSYGVCVFEIVTGFNPFSTKHTRLNTRNDGTLLGQLKYPNGFPTEVKTIIEGCLNKNRSERLGCRGEGVNEVMRQTHPFWQTLDLRAVKQGTGPVLWKPQKGVIYAEKQQNLIDHEEQAALNTSMRKIKLTKEDDLPEFDYFFDSEMHQKDIIQVIKRNTTIPRLLSNRWDNRPRINRDSNCCGPFGCSIS